MTKKILYTIQSQGWLGLINYFDYVKTYKQQYNIKVIWINKMINREVSQGFKARLSDILL